MILPIVGYGHPTLRKIAKPVEKDYPGLQELIANMFETMYNADGVGLAAPQVDLSIRLVTVGVRPYDEKTDSYGEPTDVHVLINPEILEFKGEKKYFNEGCLSVPDIHEDVLRPDTIVLHWWDENWEEHTEEVDGLFARIAQHEIDHLDGKVFVDHLSSLRRTMLKRRLNDIASGKIRTRYKMKRILTVALGLLMLTACGPNREKELAAIEQHESEMTTFDMSADESRAHDMIQLYRQFAAHFPEDSLAPVYLLRSAELHINIGENEEAVVILDSIINEYPGFEDVAGCQFLKGQAFEANQQYDLAREAYTEFVNNYPDHYLANDTRKMLPYIGMTPEEQFEAIMKKAEEQQK